MLQPLHHPNLEYYSEMPEADAAKDKDVETGLTKGSFKLDK